MNAKQTTSIATALAPLAVAAPELLLIAGIGCGVYFGLKWLLSDDKKPEKSEAAPVTAAPIRPALVIPSASGENSGQNRNIPPLSTGKHTLTPTPSIHPSAPVPVMSVPAVPKIPVPPPSAVPVVKIQPEIPLLPQKKFITRENMAKIFSGGRGLTRKSAVAALTALGFGKTAAYQALEINGRFAHWLQFASDGIITWKN